MEMLCRVGSCLARRQEGRWAQQTQHADEHDRNAQAAAGALAMASKHAIPMQTTWLVTHDMLPHALPQLAGTAGRGQLDCPGLC
ncbi:hypothetical protein HaLaN_09485 [Haematococcus lacustris]|uniref:Uncharacterized protein n=1 Tax=Haematococcus lacustris TaxID=44745 RepID=A0A699YUU0_HAELA|nr:hypothetical protein HaLaN_09485 [Haematococcus lacustris]